MVLSRFVLRIKNLVKCSNPLKFTIDQHRHSYRPPCLAQVRSWVIMMDDVL